MSPTLSFSTVAAPGAAPRAFALVLHGIFGSGGNWRTVARRVADKRPEWGFVLVDLREHGRSTGFSPPHTIDAAASDLDAVVASVAETAPVRGVLAHSFGGKVALSFRARAGGALDQTWIVDASPTARPGAMAERPDVVRVLELLESLPKTFPDREALVGEVQARGFSRPLAQWLAMSFEPSGGAVERIFDTDNLRSLLADYFARDAWSEVESERAPGQLRFVLGARSDATDTADRARLADLAGRDPERFAVHDLDAGHWVHVEALEPLVELLARELAPL